MQDELVFQVDAQQEGERLDLFLSRRLSDPSRSQLQQWIADGAVQVDGSPRKAGFRLRRGQEVRVRPPVPRPSRLVAEPIPLKILYEDGALVVIDKPAGMVVHPGAGHRSGTLANALLYRFQKLPELGGLDPRRPGIVHRLDKETSGVLVVAKNLRVQERLAAQFRKRRVDKRYLALVHGRLSPRAGSIDLPLGRHPTQRIKISTRSRRPRPARTGYRVIRWLDEFSLLEVRLYTGRTHQIRVHMQAVNHPVVGDALYAGGRINSLGNPRVRSRIRALDRHFLHAWKLEFTHPVTGDRMKVRAPAPRDLASLLTDLHGADSPGR